MRNLLPLLSFALLPIFRTSARAQVRITEVHLQAQRVELTNFGTASVNLVSWQWCRLFGYASVGGTISAGESLQFTLAMNQTSSDLCLYRPANAGETFSFGNQIFLEDFLKWGGPSSGRENVAVTKGIWTANNLLTVPASGLSLHTKAQPPATGPRNGNWFAALPHQGFPVPAPVIESFSLTGGEWRLVVQSFHLLPALRVEANGDLSSIWQIQTPVTASMGSGRFDIRFPASAGPAQFVRVRAQP